MECVPFRPQLALDQAGRRPGPRTPNPSVSVPHLANESNELRALLYARRWFRNWPIVWWYRKRARKLPPLCLRSGLTLHHRGKDLALLQIAEVLIGECYQRYISEPRSGAIVDIGANIGVATLDWALRLSGVVIHAYEPHPNTYRVLSENIVANKLALRVTAYREAVGRFDGTVALRSGDASVNSTAYGAGWAGDANEELAAPMVSFDEVVARCGEPAVELVKIDAEGAEADILEGAAAVALARVRRIVLEYHDSFVPGTLARCERVLIDAGFHRLVRSDPWRDGLGIMYAARDASDLSPDAYARLGKA